MGVPSSWDHIPSSQDSKTFNQFKHTPVERVDSAQRTSMTCELPARATLRVVVSRGARAAVSRTVLLSASEAERTTKSDVTSRTHVTHGT